MAGASPAISGVARACRIGDSGLRVSRKSQQSLAEPVQTSHVLLPRDLGQACRLDWTVVRATRYLYRHASALAHEGPADHDVALLRQLVGLAGRWLLPVTIGLRRR